MNEPFVRGWFNAVILRREATSYGYVRSSRARKRGDQNLIVSFSCFETYLSVLIFWFAIVLRLLTILTDRISTYTKMKGNRSKFFKQVIKTAAEKEAIETFKTTQETNKNGSETIIESFHQNILNQDRTEHATNQLVTVAEVHQGPMRDINKNEDKKEPESTKLEIENVIGIEQQVSEIETLTRESSKELQSTMIDIIPDDEMEIIRKSLEGENTEILLGAADNENTNTTKERQERREKHSIEMNQSTITKIIPDEDIEIIRHSLESENHEATLRETGNLNKNVLKKGQGRPKSMKKSYVDFLSEEEDFVWDSTSWKDSDDESISSEEVIKKKRKSLKNNGSADGKIGDKGLKIKKQNRRSIEKEARHKGMEYVKKDGTVKKGKEMKPNPCAGKKCGHNCEEISEEKRKKLFSYYWNLTSSKRKDWLVAFSNKRQTKRKRVKESAYRANTFEYFINEGEGRRQVCLKFILKTLDISQKYVYYTLSNANYGLSKEDERGKTIPANKTSNANRELVMNFIKSLPALPSHYCRKNTTRLYLPVEFKNLKNVYRIYKEDLTSRSLDVVSENIFREIFNKEFNLGFHVPKKDKCIKCLRFETNPDGFTAEKKEHLDEKNASKSRLNVHRELVKENPSMLCTSFDLQKVLNTPHGNSILLFYTRKYAVYNLCFYENVTREGYCYLWGESDGKRGGNEVATIMEKYISIVDSRGTVKHLILYSDSCPGQNKNKIVMTAVHFALSKASNLETIQLNYLLPGHTEMSVDSMHSVIESSVRNTIVWAPSQWLTVCQVSRKEVSPYHVQWLDHTDFKNFEEFSDKYFKGNLAGKISKIRIATFKKSALQNISVKYSMIAESQSELIPVTAKQKVAVNSKLYKTVLPITKTKYNDLKKLCETGVIPKIFHREYLILPTVNGRDSLIDTDVEDESEEED